MGTKQFIQMRFKCEVLTSDEKFPSEMRSSHLKCQVWSVNCCRHHILFYFLAIFLFCFGSHDWLNSLNHPGQSKRPIAAPNGLTNAHNGFAARGNDLTPLKMADSTGIDCKYALFSSFLWVMQIVTEKPIRLSYALYSIEQWWVVWYPCGTLLLC